MNEATTAAGLDVSQQKVHSCKPPCGVRSGTVSCFLQSYEGCTKISLLWRTVFVQDGGHPDSSKEERLIAILGSHMWDTLFPGALGSNETVLEWPIVFNRLSCYPRRH